MSTRPDDDPIDKSDDESASADSSETESRDDRVRGGFFQSDNPVRSSSGGTVRPSSSPDEDDEHATEPEEAESRGASAFDPSALFNLGAGRRAGASAGGARARRRPGGGSGSNHPPTREGGAGGRRRPGPLALTVAILVALAFVIAFLSRTWTDVLWFNQLGYSRVIWTQWIAGGGMFLVGFLIMFAAVFAAMKLAYRAREIGMPRDEAARNLESYRSAIEPLQRQLTWIVPAVLALFASAWEVAPHWREVLLAINSQSFGTADPQFGLDVSFYVFILPVLQLVVSYLSRVVVFAGICSVVVHYLYGGISVARTPHFTRAARVHLTVFLALFALLRGGSYWLGRYSALYASNTKFDGAGYTDVNASIPASAILAAISVVVALLFIFSVRTSSWRLPITGVAVMIVSALLIGVAYPAVVQKFVVDPNAQREEAAYIDRNIKATLTAYGLDDVETTNYDAKTTAEAGQLLEDAESTTSIRLLDPNLVSPTFRQLQQNKQYYSFASSLNVDRYNIDGASRDTVIAVRELNFDGLDAGQRTWINEHTVYTHGYGVVTAYGNTVASGGYPSFWEGGIPSVGDLGEYEPRIYFGQASPSYSIVGGDDGGNPRELDYPDDSAPSGQVNTTFSGNGGPDVSNPWNRLLYAVRFQEMNILFSQEVRSGSQILYNRDPADRVAEVAPWLTLDDTPYPAVVDDDGDDSTPKRVVWILDGYTTTNNYPYSQHESLEDSMSDATSGAALLGAPEESNYVRNSVKAVVDAYDGSVTLYEWDENDPILAAWKAVFPGSVTPMSEMSADLMAHMRYPEDLFKVQRTVLANYHVTDPEDFYSGGDFWKVPDDPTKSGEEAQAPYYLTLKMPDQDEATFSLSSVYIIGGNTDRNVLTGFLAVDSETAGGENGGRNPDYGKLRLLELPRSSNVSGPGQVQNNFNSNATVSQVLNLLSQQGSEVIRGNLLTLPVGGGLLYVQPVYVQASSGTQYPLLREVLVSFGDKVGFADTLSEALDQVFGGDSGATTGEEAVDGDAAAANDTSAEAEEGADQTVSTAAPAPEATAEPTQEATTQPSTAATGSGDPAADLETALSDAQTAMDDAQKAMQDGDWSAYGDAQDRLTDALNRAVSAQQQLDAQG
ncbi:UPF0182 family protein [Actinomyces sp. MRS3W]|uniref:UPF0182 family membrane protein n=1 Tax=Actinomyces sp. MRS3W TaxID=2800796 RepID=UPI0028FD0F45|nr:UPF0182 family protein [Actinomyces sp. MRS3W]MDU0348202.1 UPF0182 family protein [Actinomyces sp. MRS3W]